MYIGLHINNEINYWFIVNKLLFNLLLNKDITDLFL